MDDYPLLNGFLTMLWFFLWILWFMLLFRVIADIVRDDRLSGWGKAGWMLFVCVLPFLGAFVYLGARGKGMGRREAREVQANERALRTYIQEAAAEGAGGPTQAEELAQLAGLHDHGHLTDTEYEKAKSRVLAA
ncbi:SHOCT domain-containing protein [Streptomyces sp. NA04227]|uniref:PLD nuclease N-terminal domain-containing protein n=1 Tax=Streptomyces sp. NA04227 TaxID=2742136 RepID=UPI0015921ADF|nr:PLD nuclease N-terminal domain-containing protein [Streptomyces sp. NA04227]QKW09818.1 SHOCT domain-containing protein [Streptomyces sp. NA04227]